MHRFRVCDNRGRHNWEIREDSENIYNFIGELCCKWCGAHVAIDEEIKIGENGETISGIVAKANEEERMTIYNDSIKLPESVS